MSSALSPDLTPLAAVFAAVYTPLCRRALAFAQTPAQAEAWVQDCFVALWEAHPLPPEADWAAWLEDALMARLPKAQDQSPAPDLPVLPPAARALLQQLLTTPRPPAEWPQVSGLERAALAARLAEILHQIASEEA